MAGSPRICALSVDLDEIPNYFAIHGLGSADASVEHAVYERAVPRLLSFARAQHVPLTFFAVGSDLRHAANADAMKQAAGEGHEVANHSLDHHYDLSRKSADEMRRQVMESAAIIERVTGQEPHGFRTPGYVMNDTLARVLEDVGVRYDSSVFPCPPYYAAKAAAMGWIAARGRSSRSIVDHPRVLLAPRRPYRMGRPYYRRGDGMVELPVQVTRWLRLPYIGTALTMAGSERAKLLTRLVVGDAFINLELHGIDVLDVDDGLQGLAASQPDVRISLADKRLTLDGVVQQLREQGYRFVRMDEAARVFGAA